MLQVSDALLQTSVLQVEGLLLEHQIEHTFLLSEYLVIEFHLAGLAGLYLLLQLLDALFSEEFELLSLIHG